MRILIYGLLALSPLPFASARPAWQWLWVVVIGFMALLYLFESRQGKSQKFPNRLSIVYWLVGLFVAWGVVQTLLPLGVDAVILNQLVDPFLSKIGSISVDPKATTTNTTFYLAHGIFFWLTYVFCERRAKAAQLIRFCGVIVSLYAAYGFIVFVSGNDTILWFKKWANVTSLTSTFVNRNSFAAFAGLGLQCLIAYAYFWMQDELMEGRTGKELYRHIIETMVAKAWWLPPGIALTAIAVLLTSSRAGFGSVAIAMLALILLSPNRYQRSNNVARRLFGYSIILISGVSLFVLSGDTLETRLQADAYDQRFKVYPIIIEAIMDRPFTGFGLGTFDDVFRMYRDESILVYFDRAHNDYLELAITAGIPAAVMLVSAFVILVVYLVRRLSLGAQYRAFIVLGVTSSIQLGLHSLVDFPLQIPAISYMWCAILAASVSLANRCEKVSAGS